MKKSNHRRKSLKLRVETIRRLDAASLRQVAGGDSETPDDADGEGTRTTMWSVYSNCMP